MGIGSTGLRADRCAEEEEFVATGLRAVATGLCAGGRAKARLFVLAVAHASC